MQLLPVALLLLQYSVGSGCVISLKTKSFAEFKYMILLLLLLPKLSCLRLILSGTLLCLEFMV